MLSDLQFGFGRCRSTLDNLLKIQSDIMDSFSRRDSTVAVFFDLEKAYDITWRYGTLRSLHEAGIRGPLAWFINFFIWEKIQDENRKWLPGLFRSGCTARERAELLSFYCCHKSDLAESSTICQGYVVCRWPRHLQLIPAHSFNRTTPPISNQQNRNMGKQKRVQILNTKDCSCTFPSETWLTTGTITQSVQ